MKLVDFIKNNNEHNKVDDSVITFGLEMLKTVIIEAVAAVVIALVIGEFWRAMLFLIALMPLRQYAGGYHTKSRISCAVLSTIIYVSELLIVKYINVKIMIQIVDVIISAFIIIWLAPMENNNNPLDKIQIIHFRNKTRVFLLFDILIFVILIFTNMNDCSMVVANAINLVAVLTIMGYISNKIDKRRY
ncbi:MAG: accessory gene regulator B family protein [Lachnospira sp.]